MPAYNAIQTLRKTYDEVMAQGIVDNVIVVDDGSSDRPAFWINGAPESVVFGTNYITYIASAGAVTVTIGNEPGETHNYTATITMYSITGV